MISKRDFFLSVALVVLSGLTGSTYGNAQDVQLRACKPGEPTIPLGVVQKALTKSLTHPASTASHQDFEAMKTFLSLTPTLTRGECLYEKGRDSRISPEDFNLFFKSGIAQAAQESLNFIAPLMPHMKKLGMGSRIKCAPLSNRLLQADQGLLEEGITYAHCCAVEFCGSGQTGVGRGQSSSASYASR